MLDILFENFESNFLTVEKRCRIERCLADEFEVLSDINYLDTFIIGKPVYAWDYSTIDEGFLKLASPFMNQKSWISILYFSALEDFDQDISKLTKGVLFFEYTYYSILINDFYNFQEEFTKHEPDFRTCAALTQLRYTTQYIMNYSSHVLINNILDIDNDSINGLHKLLYNIYTTVGISRGVFMKWAYSYFEKVEKEAYFQNSINAVSNFLIFPIVAAAIISKRSDKEIYSLKKAFSYLSMFLKLNTELRHLEKKMPEPNDFISSTLLLISFQGTWIIKNNTLIDKSSFEDQKYVNIPKLHNHITDLARDNVSGVFLNEINSLKLRYLELFEAEMKQTSLLKNTTELLLKSLNQ